MSGPSARRALFHTIFDHGELQPAVFELNKKEKEAVAWRWNRDESGH